MNIGLNISMGNFTEISLSFSKGLQFGNVFTLLELLEEKNVFRDMRFSWFVVSFEFSLEVCGMF